VNQNCSLIVFALSCCLAAAAAAENPSSSAAACGHATARQCLEQALEAMGGREGLEQLKSIRLQTIGHSALPEQSYRQAPFITSYERDQVTLDLTGQRMLVESKQSWPENDLGDPDTESISVIGLDGGVNRGKEGDSPSALADVDTARQTLALGPQSVLLTAAGSADLHLEAPKMIRGTLHAALAFTWRQIPVRVLLNPFNHLPDAVETTQEFHDFWYFWGDVTQRIYFDNWKLINGIHLPTNWVEERNDLLWKSTQALNVEINVPIEETAFARNPEAVRRSVESSGWNRPFRPDKPIQLASGVDLYPGSWNSTLVKEPDGVVILEAPISETYTQGVIAEAAKRYPGVPIEAVLSTSDSWPHTGGVRLAVSKGLPVYILDSNKPLLDRIVSARHTIRPDSLQRSNRKKPPNWKIVAKKERVGSGENRMELYPIRGALTERQYMVYFPQHHLLYASDTLVLYPDGRIYDPEMMDEIARVVEREHLVVDMVFAMHQGPTPWAQVMVEIEKARHS
jgi:hypothetical protein